MHKIKAQARRSAWFNSEGEKTYNPFQRYNPPLRTGVSNDEESGLRQINTHDAITWTEDKRRSQYNAENAPWRGVEKSGTFPPGPAGRLPSGERGDYSSTEKSKSEDIATDNSTTYGEKSRELPAEDIAAAEAASNEHGKPQKRNKFLSAFAKDHPDEQNVMRTETDESKKRRPKLTFMSQVRAVFGSWINILLVAVPVGIALEYSGVNKVVVFVVNFIAIIPLAAVLSYSTEELAMYIGEVLGGLLNATFGNAVELIVSIIALTQGKVLIVQTSLIGSMLSNLLLVLGMCFFLGGVNRTEQHFNITVAQTAASLLALAIGSLIIPTAFRIFADDDSGVTPSSRGTAVMLLAVYACYLIFQLRTHVDMYNEPSQKTPKKPRGKKEDGEALKGIAMIGAASGAATAGGRVNQENLVQEAPEEEEMPALTKLGAVITLAISTVFIALCAEYMVSSINAVADSVSQEFIGLILLPIVGNAAEHATAVTVAIKDKMDLSIGVAVGSSLQIALLVLPVMVLLSWFGVGKPEVLNLDFDGFLVVILVLSIWLVNYLISDGKSHWLEGVMLMITYLIIATTAWFYPAKGEVAG
ncbi:Vacuolar calcium ion transporter [Fulvia fulva]|uniref:Vacuolar calcium ion transporter n=1 Tax=Passalora fulva TaxID=5499 RepID=A0A9Q8PDP9_PASFU|nr:Vacuolar calcium ion transporter [Fulvia fulva]KAK4618091.1 Vacuolar calcium ion transporter [Fulvia fulva]KAK4619063.1 Vacuolar calcium ion transporter [Fulvia fulva]UJO20522.1 Vacuolar calcium ion transporter [Fulvia fulva]WPV18282.1 Vacuolar calcium ion transporter [Fulvia fulva]WPV32897.1 Vacuolar calcium ion transporter [Fulvia fulva]